MRIQTIVVGLQINNLTKLGRNLSIFSKVKDVILYGLIMWF